MGKIDRSLTLSWRMLDRNLFFIRFRTEKERSPSVFATGSVRYSCVPASRGALGHGLHRLCLNRPVDVHAGLFNMNVVLSGIVQERQQGACANCIMNLLFCSSVFLPPVLFLVTSEQDCSDFYQKAVSNAFESSLCLHCNSLVCVNHILPVPG
jgi:hypothetical protein